jgi:hypothetical protein
MNQRNLLILFAALGLVALAAWLLSPDDAVSLSEGDVFLPGLAEALNEVTSLTVRRAGDTLLVELERKDNSWLVTNRDDYPANFDRVRQNLRGLSEARIFEAKTVNPEFYERLGVRDISDAQATGSELDIRAGNYSAKVIVGRTDEGGGSLAYLRRAGEAQSYLVTASLDPGSSAADWLDTAILDLPSTRVRSVEISRPDGEILAIAKPRSESTNYTVADIPERRSLAYDGAANAIGAALASLRLDDVQPAAGFDAGDVEPVVARFNTFDGLSIEVRSWELEDRTVHAFSAVAGEKSAEDETSAPADSDALAQINAEVDAINARVADWIYVVPSFKAEQFTQRMSDLLAAEE